MPQMYIVPVLFFLTESVESSRVGLERYWKVIDFLYTWVRCMGRFESSEADYRLIRHVSEWDSIPVDWLDSVSVPV